MSILSRFFEQKGIDPRELSPEEKVTVEQWQSTFAKADKDVTVADIADFCQKNLALIETQFANLDTPKDKLQSLVLLHSVYTAIRNLINAPNAEREQFERYLSTLLSKSP